MVSGDDPLSRIRERVGDYSCLVLTCWIYRIVALVSILTWMLSACQYDISRACNTYTRSTCLWRLDASITYYAYVSTLPLIRASEGHAHMRLYTPFSLPPTNRSHSPPNPSNARWSSNVSFGSGFVNPSAIIRLVVTYSTAIRFRSFRSRT